MSANNNRSKKLLKTIMKANAGCGCGKPKLSDVFEPEPKPKPKPSLIRPHSQTLPPEKCNSSSSNDGVSITTTDQYDTTTTTTELSSSSTPRPAKAKAKRINDSCIAVVKESDDPFRDFKQSMKQMIVEKEIYDKPDLEELLACFLQLNTASHRDVIVRAFADIWNDVVSERLVIVGTSTTTNTTAATTASTTT